MTVSIQATGQGPGILGHIGSVEDVIAATGTSLIIANDVKKMNVEETA